MDEIREWISDNLRYILLGAALIVVIVLAVTVIRAVTHTGSSQKTKTETEAETAANADVIVDESEGTGEEATLVQNDAKVLTIMTSYYTAKTNKDIETLKKLDPSIDEEQEQANLESSYVESYSNIKTYSKEGPSEGGCVVYVCYDGKVKDIDTLVPSLTQFYLMTDDNGDYYIADTDGNTEVEEFLEETRKSSEVQALIDLVNTECEEAQESDPVLKEFMEQYGNSQDSEEETESADSTSSDSGETTELVANDSVNVRSEPSTDSDENIIGGLYAGDTVTSTGETDDGWTIIDYNGETGYVKSEFLSSQDSSEDSEEVDYFSPDYTGEESSDTTTDGTTDEASDDSADTAA